MPSTLTLHLVLLNVLNVVQTLRDHEVMPLIPNDFNDETVPGLEVASHLELRETEPPDVHVADDVDGKHLEQSFRELEVTEELLARAKEAPELPADICSNGTWHLSGDFKVTKEALVIHEPCNITADRVTLFLEHFLGFRDTVHFHGDLAVVALRPLDFACVQLGGTFVEPGAVLRLAGCQNGYDLGRGGAMYVGGNLDVRGELHIRHSWAKNLGGAIFVWDNLNQFSGTLTITNSSAEQGGGAMYVEKGSFNQSGGNLTITDAFGESDGGAIYVKEGSFTQLGGNLTIADASAKSHGGAIYVYDNLNQFSGTLTIMNASAKGNGGAIYMKQGSFNQSGGNLTITDAFAESDGGAIYVEQGSFTQSGGNLTITDASAKSDGGAMWIAGNLTMKKNKLFITHATAKIGGGIWVGGDGLFEDAVASFDQCHALEDGGGIRAIGDVDVVNTSLTFNSSIATSGHGAALVAKNFTQYGGGLVILNSSAGQEIISVRAWTTDSAVRLEDCRSSTFLVAVQEAALNGTLSSNNCTGAAGTLVSQGLVELRNAVFNKTSSPQVRAPMFEGSNWIVTGTETWISAPVSNLHKIDCDHVFAGVVNEDGVGCRTCDPGFTFVKLEGVTIGSVKGKKRDMQQCRKCPEGASTCNATAIQMSPGLMVNPSNVSRPYHCPNPLACPGGLLLANGSTQMCTKGYRGIGCETCDTDFARTDSNIF